MKKVKKGVWVIKSRKKGKYQNTKGKWGRKRKRKKGNKAKRKRQEEENEKKEKKGAIERCHYRASNE